MNTARVLLSCLLLFLALATRAGAALPPPQTLPADNFTTNSATLHGASDWNKKLPGYVAFQIRRVGARWPLSHTPWQRIARGQTNVVFAANVTALKPGTNYQFRTMRYVAGFTRYGAALGFSALAVPTNPPTVLTVGATNVTSADATLTANVNPNRLASAAWFEWGTTTNYGNATAPVSLSADMNDVPIQAVVGSLTPGRPYHFRAVAANGFGTNYGTDDSFETLPTIVTVTNGTDAELRAAVAGFSTVLFNFDGVIELTNTLVIDASVQIDGSGHIVTLSGGGSNRLFNVKPGGGLSLLNLTLDRGSVRGTNGNPAAGPAPFGPNGQPGESVEGGAVLLQNATLYAESCSFSNCSAVAGNGGSAPDFQTGWIRGGAGNARGACLSAYNSVITLSNCVFAGNAAIAGLSGSGGFINDNTPRAGIGIGGVIAVTQGTVTVSECSFSQNNSTAQGGAIYNDGASLSVVSSVFWSCTAGTSSPVVAGYGGAILHGAGALKIEECLFDANFAGGSPGFGLNVSAPGQNGYGGGLAVLGGTAVIERSTFRRNEARGGAGAFQLTQFGVGSPGEGFGGALFSQAAVAITNTTFSQNSAYSGHAYYPAFVTSAGRGGALAVGAGSVQIISSTLASNIANSGPNITNASFGGACYVGGGLLTMGNSILAGNRVNGSDSNCFGSLTDLGHNLSSDSTPVWSSGTSMNNTDPLLGPLSPYLYGGLMYPLLLGSPAIDAADPLLSPATDQRGVARPQGPAPDIGSVER